jgi:low temperature requirement protein LtrA
MMVPLISAWILTSVIIACFGTKRRFGFWGYLFASLLLTPVIGFLLLAAAIPPRGQRG